jgi:glucan endo-1,3-alpha-glucosidase
MRFRRLERFTTYSKIARWVLVGARSTAVRGFLYKVENRFLNKLLIIRAILLLLISVIYLNRVSAQESSTVDANKEKKYVFAHYMVCCPTHGLGSTVDDYKQEIIEAEKMRVDGFALNCGHWSEVDKSYKNRVLLIYKAAQQLNTDFKLFISDDGLSVDELSDVVNTLGKFPNQFYFRGKFVLSTFSQEGEDDQKGKILTNFSRRLNLFFIPFFYPRPFPPPEISSFRASQLVSEFPDMDGYFYFAAGTTPDQVVRSNENLSTRLHSLGKIYMAGIYPYYRGNSTNYRLFDTKGFQGMQAQWMSAINVNADWVELVTWNDWGESTYIAQYGPPASVSLGWGGAGKLLDHTAYLKASQYFIKWFKSGKKPDVVDDELFYFYRLHPADLNSAVTPRDVSPTKRPRNADTLKDEIYATAFLKAPARLIIRVAGSTRSFDLPAGVQNVEVPFGLGRPEFELQRDGDIIVRKQGEQSISASDVSTRFNYFSGSAYEKQ